MPVVPTSGIAALSTLRLEGRGGDDAVVVHILDT